MTSIPAEFYALVNAFLFALHNMFTKKALRYSNPATAVISGLLINIIILWGLSVLFVPLSSLTSASILIFAVVGLFQPGLTRLLSYKGIDALGVAITDPIRATTPLFSAIMAIIFLGEKMTLPIVVGTGRRHASCPQVRHGRGAASVSRSGGDGDIIFRRVGLDALVCREKPGDVEDEPANAFGGFSPPA